MLLKDKASINKNVLSSLPHFFRLIKDLKLDVQYHIEQALL
jgi:hypothetical protein